MNPFDYQKIINAGGKLLQRMPRSGLPATGSLPNIYGGPNQNIPRPSSPNLRTVYAQQTTAKLPAIPAPKTPSSFLANLYYTVRGMPEEEQQNYFMDQRAMLMNKLARYDYRLARGVFLSPDQAAQYETLRKSISDIDEYLRNPEETQKYMEGSWGGDEINRLKQLSYNRQFLANMPRTGPNSQNYEAYKKLLLG